jgi:hypothetical protein
MSGDKLWFFGGLDRRPYHLNDLKPRRNNLEAIFPSSDNGQKQTRGMANVRSIKRKVIPQRGSFEVRFPDGSPSRYWYSDDLPSRRLRPDHERRCPGAGQGFCSS